MMQSVNLMLAGAIGMASIIASLFFLQFWRMTRDRFFLFFSASFLVEGTTRIFSGLNGDSNENIPILYVIRLAAYALILLAIIDKNMRGKDDS